MTILNVGSINVDTVYRVPRLPDPGETISALSKSSGLGGKGLNQSVAIAKSGGNVKHFGAIGADDGWITEELSNWGINCDLIKKTGTAGTGEAIILVSDDAENSIVLLEGANNHLDDREIGKAINDLNSEDWLLVQNETNALKSCVEQASKSGVSIALSAAPFDVQKVLPLLPMIDLLCVNEIELTQLLAAVGSLDKLPEKVALLITKGSKGATYLSEGQSINVSAHLVDAIDTTGAGDTFLGCFLANFDLGSSIESCLELASAASAVQVTKTGAASAIPSSDEVCAFLENE